MSNIRPGHTYTVRLPPDANITMPSGVLYVTVEDGPFPDGTTLVSFSMAIRVRTEDLSYR